MVTSPFQVVGCHEHYSGFSGGHTIQGVEETAESDATKTFVCSLHYRGKIKCRCLIAVDKYNMLLVVQCT